MDELEVELKINLSGLEAERKQTLQPAETPGKQAVLSDKTVAIGFCGTDRNFVCTVTAISAANYIADCGYKVSLVEPDFSKGMILNKLLPGLSKDNMIQLQNVDYYTGWDLSENILTADVVIFDFSSMNYEESCYLCKMKKIFICSDTEPKDLSDSGKLGNNSSFRYSILFSEVSGNQEIDSENDVRIVFKECSLELKRLLALTLHDYGLDIPGNMEVNSAGRINYLNMLREAEILSGDGAKAKPERQAKYEEPESSQPEPIPYPKVSAPKIKPPATNQANIKDDEYYNYIGIDNKKVVSNEKEAMNTREAMNTKEALNSKEALNTKEALNSKGAMNTIEAMYTKDTTNIKGAMNTKEALDRKESANTINRKNVKESLSSSGAYINPAQQLNKESRNAILPGWLNPGKGNEYEENSMNDSNFSYKETEKENENKKLKEDDLNYDYTNFEDRKGSSEEQNNIFNYAEEIKLKFKKKQPANQVLCGKETIFITGLKHGCGCSHTGISFTKYIFNSYSENICICHKKGAYDLEEENITEYTKDTDYDNIFSTNRFIIYDCGILGELNQEQLIELKRCNIKIMVCNGDEKYLGNLAKFIRQLGKSSGEWIFAFNLITSREKETMIRKIMEGYKICFIPLHDSEDPPKKIGKLWESILKRNLL